MPGELWEYPLRRSYRVIKRINVDYIEESFLKELINDGYNVFEENTGQELGRDIRIKRDIRLEEERVAEERKQRERERRRRERQQQRHLHDLELFARGAGLINHACHSMDELRELFYVPYDPEQRPSISLSARQASEQIDRMIFRSLRGNRWDD